jgi:hypothetical protein
MQFWGSDDHFFAATTSGHILRLSQFLGTCAGRVQCFRCGFSRSAFGIETHYVFCDAGSAFLNVVHMNLRLASFSTHVIALETGASLGFF